MRTTFASLLAASLLSIAAAARADAPGATVAAQAATDPGPQNSITTNPVELALGLANVAYERALGLHSSIQIEGLYGSASATDDNGDAAHVAISGVTVQPHFYFANKKALSGVYVAPLAEVLHLSASDSSSTVSVTGLELGATIGYSIVAGPLNVKLGLGAGYAIIGGTGVHGDGTLTTVMGSGPTLTADLSMGVAF